MRVLKLICWLLLAGTCGSALIISGAYLYLTPDLPSVETLRDTKLQIPLRIYSQDNKLIAEYGDMRRSPIPFDKIPPDFTHALLAAEDDNFNRHHGVDLHSLARAFIELAHTGEIQTGGSTITMQVAKNYFLSNERSFSRKATEILLALQIERTLTKDEIFELYINKIYLGHHAYGIEAAAEVYYGRPIADLSIAQMATIAGLPKAPSRYNPLDDPKRSLLRRNWILERMYRLGNIDEAQYQLALSEPLGASYHAPIPELLAPYVAETVRAEMVGRYGEAAYTDGYVVHVTVPSHLQSAATLAVQRGLLAYDHRHGYRGPERRLAGQDRDNWLQALKETGSVGGLKPAVVTQVDPKGLQVLLRDGQEAAVPWSSMQWARPYINQDAVGARPQSPTSVAHVGDLIRIQSHKDGYAFTQVPQAQGALISLDPANGAILAMVGGFGTEKAGYNRATQAKRQPGSSFKPFIYAAALDKGYTPATIVNDAPLPMMYQGTGPDAWHPKNDSGTFLGPIPLRVALYRSRNLAAVRTLSAIGIGYTLKYLQNFGFDPKLLPRNLSLALGTADLTPLQIATGWAVFANNGYRVTPYLIESINDRDGHPLFVADPAKVPTEEQRQQLSADTAATQATSATAPAPEAIDPATGLPVAGGAPTSANWAEQAIDPRTAYIVTNMLQDVIKYGTGRQALSLNRTDIAGKTGTTNEAKDSWFSGFNGRVLTTVWSGFDQPQSLGKREFGSTLSLPIWIDFMGTALAGSPPYLPPQPAGIVTAQTAQGRPELFKVGQETSSATTDPQQADPNGAPPANPSGTSRETPSTMDLF